VLDLVEYANGPATSTWGAKRAAAGHPEPFRLKYLGIGNEDKITPVFKERFQMIFEAVKAKHPEITVIGTVGPRPNDDDYTNGWKIADELRVPMVDEHYYQSPQWFWDNLRRYDTYDRGKSKVYVGEYAAHDDKRRTTLRSALAEAACLTSLERNGDVVAMASYAPLLARRGHTHWNPDLIYFSNTEVAPTINYFVQQLFSVNAGDAYLTTTVNDPAKARDFAVSSVRESKTGDVILKLVNAAATAKALRVELAGAKNLSPKAVKTVLAGNDPMAVNDFASPRTVLPQTSTLTIAPAFDYEAPANSLTVIRIIPR
jgi:alpha-L-arabinofuranosidase